MESIDLIITLTGTALVMIAIFVEIEHNVIWKKYRRHYHPHKNKLIDTLIKPNRVVYALNIYILWPLVLVMGLYMLFRQSA